MISYSGITARDLKALLARGVDDAGAPIEGFQDIEGGWPLRCCLTDSVPGDAIAIVGHSPFPWVSPYRETGPIVVHTENCPGPTEQFPRQFEARAQVVKAFGRDAGRIRTQVYDLNALVQPGQGLARHISLILQDPRVEEVHVHNVVSQCFSFKAFVSPAGE